jgi:hypothetical protein
MANERAANDKQKVVVGRSGHDCPRPKVMYVGNTARP